MKVLNKPMIKTGLITAYEFVYTKKSYKKYSTWKTCRSR